MTSPITLRARRRQDLAEAEQADRDRHDADAVAEFGDVERVAEVAGHDVDADHAEQQPEARHQQRADQRRRRHVGEEDQAEHRAARCIPAGRSAARSVASGGATTVSTMTPKVPAMNEPTAAMHSAAPARPFLRHGVAVDAGHHRGGLARNAHQDRGGRAAVLRAVVDAGQHDDAPWWRRARRSPAAGWRCPRAARCRAACRPACRPGSRGRRTRDCRAGTRPRSRAAGCGGSLPRR